MTVEGPESRPASHGTTAPPRSTGRQERQPAWHGSAVPPGSTGRHEPRPAFHGTTAPPGSTGRHEPRPAWHGTAAESGTTGRQEPRRLPAPLGALAGLAVFVTAVRVLGWRASTGTEASAAVVRGMPWLAWRATAAIALLVFAILALRGWQLLRYRAGSGLPGVPPRQVVLFTLAATLAVAIIAVFFLGVGAPPTDRPRLPINGLRWRASSLVIAGLLAGVPWLALVWLAHERCRQILAAATSVGRPDPRTPEADQAAPSAPPGPAAWAGPVARPGPAASPGPAAPPGLPAASRACAADLVRGLLALWELLSWCVAAFAVSVVAALVCTGALRSTFVAAFPARASDFPSSQVLLYGAAYAALLLIITLPVVLTWRAAATAAVDQLAGLPEDLALTAEWAEARARAEHVLRLDVSVMRSPLTALSTLAPLATAALAAYLPDLAR